MGINRSAIYRVLTGLVAGIMLVAALSITPKMRAEAATSSSLTSVISSCPSGAYAQYYNSQGKLTTAYNTMRVDGYNGTGSSSGTYYKFTNTEYNPKCYAWYRNAVIYGDKRYDLWIYPWVTGSASYCGVYSTVTKSSFNFTDSKTPGFYSPKSGESMKFKMVITESPDPETVFDSLDDMKEYSQSHPIDWQGWFGFGDMDSGEICNVYEHNYLESSLHIGSKVKLDESAYHLSSIDIAGLTIPAGSRSHTYKGTGSSDSSTFVWDTGAFYGIFKIPAEGALMGYGGSAKMTCLDFSQIVGSGVVINMPSYILDFDGNGSTGGSLPPSKTLLYGDSTGDIGSSCPTRSGYTFRGWSSSRTLQSPNRRIVYSSSQAGGSAYAKQTAATWTIEDYLKYTGGSLVEEDGELYLHLYAQWEPNIIASVSDKTTTYTGSPIAANSVSVTTPSSGYTVKYGTSFDSCTLSSPPTWTNAGTYVVYYQITASGYITKTGSYSLAINRAPGSITTSNQSTDYPSTKQISYLRIGDGTVSVTSSDTSVATVAMSGEGITATPKKTGTTTITISAAQGTNHTAASKSITFTVNPGTITASASNKSATYSGNAQTAPDGITVSSPTSGVTKKYSKTAGSYTTTRPSWTNAGTYTVYYELTATNYTTKTGSYTFTINPVSVTIPTANTGLVYNGSEKTGVNTGEGYTLSGHKATNAGSYTAVAALSSSNYKWSDGTATNKNISWSIAKAPGSVTASDQSTTYPAAKTLTYSRSGDGTISATSSDTSVATVAVSGTTIIATPKKVGSTNITISAAQGTNHTAASKTIKFTVNPAKVTPPAANTGLVYNGSEQRGVPLGSDYYVMTHAEEIKAGTYTSAIVLRDDKNYTWSDGTTTEKQINWSIERAPVSVPSGTDYIYDGTEKTGVPEGMGYVRSGKYAATLVGDYTATVTPDSDHKWTDNTTVSKDIVWHIMKRQIKATATRQALVYTGNPLTAPDGVTVTEPDNYTIVFGREENDDSGLPSYTEAGTYTVYFKVTADNYDDFNGSYEFEIEEKRIQTPAAVSLTYNGEEQTGVPEGEGYAITGNTGTDAGNYVAVATPLKNYRWYSGTGSKNIPWSIARKGISEPDAVSGLVYDGTEKTGVSDGTGYTVTDNTGTDAGNYIAKATPDSNYQWDNGSNTTETRDIPWSIERAQGSVRIADDSLVLIYPASGTFTYEVTGDGGISVSSGDTSKASVSAEGSTVTVTPVNVGECAVTVSMAEGRNYTAASDTIGVTVEPGTIQATCTKQTGYYSGNALTPAGITVTEPEGAAVLYSETTVRTRSVPSYTLTSPPSLTNAGSYNILYQVTAPNYAPLTGSYDVDINKASISVEVPHTKVTYDGYLKQADGIRVLDPESGAVVKYGITPGVYDLEDTPSFTEAGEHMVYYSVTADNYNDLTGSYAFEILPANIIVSAKNGTGVYSGSPQTPGTVTVLYPGDASVLYKDTDGSYSLSGPAPCTDAGIYTVYYRVSADNFYDKEGSYTFEITRKPVSVPSAVSGLTYTGEIRTGVLSANGLTIRGNTGVDAGDYTAVASVDNNHIWNDDTTGDKEIGWSIGKAVANLTVSDRITTYPDAVFPDYVSDSDGEVTVVSSDESIATVSENRLIPLKSGVTEVTVSQAETRNYRPSARTFRLTVLKGASKIKPVDNIVVTYPEVSCVPIERTAGTGSISAKTSDDSVVTVSMNGLRMMLTPVKPGRAIITAEQAETDQYEASSAMFVITVRSGVFRAVSEGYENIVYDGSYRAIGRVDVTAPTDADNKPVPYTVSYRTGVNNGYTEEMPLFRDAGTYTVFYKVSAENYEDLEGSFTGEVKKADSVIDLLSPSSFRYDGHDHSLAYSSRGAGDITIKTLSGNSLASVSPSQVPGNEDVEGGVIRFSDITGTGTMLISVKMSETRNYSGVEKRFTVEITPEKYSISFDTGKGVITRELTYGDRFTFPEVGLDGYGFTGWYDGDRLVTSEMTGTIPVPTGDTTYTARFKGNPYTVFFDPNGGRGSIPEQERVFDDRKELPSFAGFRYKAHIFSHWSTEPDDTGAKFFDRSTRNVSAKDDVTLYAIWTESPIPDESLINEDKAAYEVGDRYYLDGSLYICIKDTDDNTPPDGDPEHWAKTGDEETDNTIPFNSDTLTVSGNTLFNRGDYIYVENSNRKTSDIYVCLTDGTDGSEWLTDNWKKIGQIEASLIYNTNVIYNSGDTIYKDGAILICNEDGTTGAFRSEHWIKQTILAKSVKAESEEQRIGMRGRTRVTATIFPVNATDKTVVWESLTPEIATVDDEGQVLAVSEGVAEILCTASSGVSDSVEIEIFIDLDNIDLSENEVTIREGEERKLVPVFTPADCEHPSVRWISDDPSVVSVDADGTIKGLKRGESTDVRIDCGGVQAVCRVNVTDPCTVTVAPKKAVLYMDGKECRLTAVVDPEYPVTWSSSDESVAVVDENGVVTARGIGDAFITATAKGVSDSCSVTVKDGRIDGITLDTDYFELTVGDFDTLTARTTPSNIEPEGFVWTVDDENAVSLAFPGDENRRVITMNSMGVYTITVTETSSGLSASCTVRGIAYYDFAKEGNLVTSSSEHEVRKIKGSFYCFDSLGRAEAGFITVNGSDYYFDPDTGIAVKGLQEIKGSLYFFDKKTCVMVKDNKVKVKGFTYHFGSDGKAVGGVYYLPDKKTGAWFYFDEDAVMQSGVFRVSLSGERRTLDPVGERPYCFKNGKLFNPKKEGFVKMNGYRYYIYPDGHAATGIVEIPGKKGKKTCFFDNEGRLIVGAVLSGNRLLPVNKDGQLVSDVKPGLTKVGCDFYWYESDGSLLTGWKDVTGKDGAVKATYYFDTATGASSSGIRVIDGVRYVFVKGACVRKDSIVTVNRRKYAVKVDGTGRNGCATLQHGFADINGKTYYADPVSGVIRTGLITLSGNTLSLNMVYAGTSGVIQKDKWIRINKKRYHTDSNGFLQTGRISVNGKIYYLDPFSKPAGVMMTGLIEEDDIIYLYGANGVLQTGNKFVSFKGRKYFVDGSGKVMGLEEGTITDAKGVTYELDKDGAVLNGTKEKDGNLYLYKNGQQVIGSKTPKKGGMGSWKTVAKKKYLVGFSDSTLSANIAFTGLYTDVKGKEYLLKKDGAMASAELIEIPSEEITAEMTSDANGDYWYYYNKKGQKVTKAMTKDNSGWYKVAGTKASYIYDSGCAASGWMKIGDKEYYFDPVNGTTTVQLSFIERLLWELK